MGTELLRPGVFLLARPSLSDPNFEGAVVLLVAHSQNGSLGLVVNRPTGVPLARVLEEAAPFGEPETALFWGGPVALVHLHVLHGGSGPEDSLEVCPGVRFGGDLAAVEAARSAGAPVRFYLGYSGWGEHQLEEEMETDTWLVLPASQERVFDDDPGTLWQRLVAASDRRWSWLDRVPEDPSVN